MLAVRIIISFCVIAMVALGGGTALAQPAEVKRYTKALSAVERKQLHYLLAWSGVFQGAITDTFDESSIHSVTSFQTRLGNRATGLLNPKEIEALVEHAKKAVKETNYKLVKDNFSGSILGLPQSVRFKGQHKQGGAVFADEKKRLRVQTFAYLDNSRSLLKLYKELLADVPKGRLLEDRFRGDNFTLSWASKESEYRIIRFKDRRGILKGMTISFQLDDEDGLAGIRLANLIVSDFEPFKRVARTKLLERPKFRGFVLRRKPPRKGGGGTRRGPVSSGTGFFVSEAGHILTNAHVVDGCQRILVGEKKQATLIGYDDQVDLAVLKTEIKPEVFAAFTDAPIRLGEDIAAFGFPLRGILAEELNMTTGNVSSLRGLRGNKLNFQFTAPVQSGNSGGPVIDQVGRVVGVVTSKLDALRIAKSAGDVPQLVNFAVTYGAAVRFLLRWGVKPSQVPAGEPMPSWKLAATAQKFVLPILCYQRPSTGAKR